MSSTEHAHTDDVESPETPPDSPVASVERVNAVLGRWHRLEAEIEAYDRLHRAEIERLDQRRQATVGPIERRIARLRRSVEQFAVQSFLTFGKTNLHVPNGDITSRPVVPAIERDDQVAHRWMSTIDDLNDAWEFVPKIDLRKLRSWLDERLAVGHLQRLVGHRGGDWFVTVDEEQGWHSEFGPDEVGYWFWTETGAEAYGTREGEMLPGVTWAPKGTLGSGRNFKVKL